jgi:hypothetical protein
MKARLIIAGIVLVLAMAVAPAALAAPPCTTTHVSGNWSWVNNSATITTLDNGDMLVDGDEYGTWTGTFAGSSYDVFEMTFAPPLEGPEWGAAWGTLTATFKGKVGGKNGHMTMFFTIREAANSTVMTGTWVILSGTKALKHVSGSGTWVSSGFDSSATYAGMIRWKGSDGCRLPHHEAIGSGCRQAAMRAVR